MIVTTWSEVTWQQSVQSSEGPESRRGAASGGGMGEVGAVWCRAVWCGIRTAHLQRVWCMQSSNRSNLLRSLTHRIQLYWNTSLNWLLSQIKYIDIWLILGTNSSLSPVYFLCCSDICWGGCWLREGIFSLANCIIFFGGRWTRFSIILQNLL